MPTAAQQLIYAEDDNGYTKVCVVYDTDTLEMIEFDIESTSDTARAGVGADSETATEVNYTTGSDSTIAIASGNYMELVEGQHEMPDDFEVYIH